MSSVKDITSKKEERDGIVYIDVLDCKFRLTGLPWKNSNGNYYHRLDDRINDKLSPGLKVRSNNIEARRSLAKRIPSVFSVHIVRNTPRIYGAYVRRNATGGTDIYIGSGKEKFWHVLLLLLTR